MSREILDVAQVDGSSARAAAVARIPDFRIAVGEASGFVDSADWPAGVLAPVPFV